MRVSARMRRVSVDGKGDVAERATVEAWLDDSDIAILYGRGNYPSLWVKRLLNLTIAPICSPQLLQGPHALTGPEDLADYVVCTVTGSTSYNNIVEYETKDIITTDTYSACLEPIRSGTAQVLTTDNVILAGLAAESDGEFEVISNPFTEEPYGIGLGHDDTEFRNWINDLLEEIYADGRWVSAWESTAGTVLATPEPPAVDRYTN